ncbi:hypothetical protein KMW28_20725 [Flammeovirga yaeyamensis]|uniref:Uncharacterized protein n=1 Tax=Flammeovirga yaeyamensis TaxID=367791 RepID=A0AAX1ND29_9BACT|nr:hypothetical protein [Flammeovirga yaeyamensis]MBB3697230.1 hypothetical protein [Flammeovirga yaeyamensis]NMF33889.1 hypothetical protein [Flammeovirga yaeyamensis]QWG04851.1 hypothetical protein KMW28_20725 [Flammeovirga yaeyamensis]
MNLTKHLLKPLSYIGLAITLVPCILVFLGEMEVEIYKQTILFGSLLWMFTAPWWINKS